MLTLSAWKFNIIRTVNALRDIVVCLGGTIVSVGKPKGILMADIKNEREKDSPVVTIPVEYELSYVYDGVFYHVRFDENSLLNHFYSKERTINGRIGLNSKMAELDLSKFWINENEREYMNENECRENAKSLFGFLYDSDFTTSESFGEKQKLYNVSVY